MSYLKNTTEEIVNARFIGEKIGVDICKSTGGIHTVEVFLPLIACESRTLRTREIKEAEELRAISLNVAICNLNLCIRELEEHRERLEAASKEQEGEA